MASTSAQSISALLQKSSLDDHDEILRSCNAVLKKSKSDVLAQHAKAIALLKLDRYDEALQIFESAGKTLQEKAPLDYAYSLYKNGNHRKAAESVAGLKEGRGARHLQAQAVYKCLSVHQSERLTSRHEALQSRRLWACQKSVQRPFIPRLVDRAKRFAH